MLAVLTVTSADDTGPGTLREAIVQANTSAGVPDEIVFDPALFATPQTIPLDSPLPEVLDPLTITGPGADLLALDGQHGADRIPQTNDGWSLLLFPNINDGQVRINLQGLTIRNADGFSAIQNGADLSLSDVAFEDNHARISGAALRSGGRLQVLNSRFLRNHSEGGGGAISSGNEGAIIQSTLFQQNVAERSGGAIASALVTVIDSTFLQNEAEEGGGAIISDFPVVTDSIFAENRAVSGGALFHAGEQATIRGSLFRQNEAAADGGGVFGRLEITIEDSTFVENAATEGGGAYLIGSVATVVPSGEIIREVPLVISSTFSGNQAEQSGAAIQGEDGGIEVRHSTVVNNRLDRFRGLQGGAIEAGLLTVGGRIVIDHSIVTGTSVVDLSDPDEIGVPANDLAISRFDPSEFQVTNSLIGLDQPDFGNGSFLVDRDAGNLVGESLDARLDPRLAPLADNGGPTPTHAPLPTSLAINAGDPDFVAADGASDQRGGPHFRVAGGRIDIGAFEAQGDVVAAPGDFNADGVFDAADYTLWRDTYGQSLLPLTGGDATGDGLVDEADRALWLSRFGDRYLVGQPVVNNLIDDDDGDITNGRTTLREAIRYANENPWVRTITFDASLSGGVIEVDRFFNQDPRFLINRPLTIDARTLPEGLTVSGISTIFRIEPVFGSSSDFPLAIDVTLAGITIASPPTDPFFFGRAINSDSTGTLSLLEVHLDGREGSNFGVFSQGPITIVDSLLEGLRDSGDRSVPQAITSRTGVTLIRSELRSNDGDAIGVIPISSDPFLPPPTGVHLVDSVITGVHDGQAINTRGDVLLERSRIEGNLGGAIKTNSGNVSLVDSVVRNNTSPSPILSRIEGGAGVVADGNITLLRSRVENNHVLVENDFFQGDGGGVAAFGRVTAIDSSISGNTAARGGGIYALGNGVPPEENVVSLVGTAVNDNRSRVEGAAIYVVGSLAIEGSSVSNNTAAQLESPTTVIQLEPDRSGDTPRLTVTQSVLANNSAGQYGAVVSQFNSVTITGSQIVDNQAGTAVFADSLTDSVVARNSGLGVFGIGNLAITGSTISGNRGGGVRADGRVDLIDSTVRGNTLDGTELGFDFGAAGITADVLVAERSIIADNQKQLPREESRSAGGVSAYSVIAIDTTISGNTVSGEAARGGGINARTAVLYGTTLSNNAAIGENARGGGLSAGTRAKIFQSTISGNRVEGLDTKGAGIDVSTGEFFSVHSTVVDNTAIGIGSTAGGLAVESLVALEGSVVARNSAEGTAPDLSVDSIVDPADGPGVQYSLIGDTTGSPIDAATGIGNLLGIDPLLGPLADNGGPTLTHAPLAGSPLINAGDPTRDAVPLPLDFPAGFLLNGLSDQRGDGFSRLTDGGDASVFRIDIGSVEFPGEAGPAPPSLQLAFLPVTPESSRLTTPPIRNQASLIPSSVDHALLLIDTTAPRRDEEQIASTPSDTSPESEEPLRARDLALSTF